MTFVYLFGALTGGFLLLLAIWLFATVDDWSRDLTTNQASTSASSQNPSLHPIVSDQSAGKLADLVVVASTQLNRWELKAREENDEEVILHFIRTTPLLRFKDDITVHIRPHENQQRTVASEVTAESRSRIGKADFGQNPRNLAELMDKIRSLLR